MPDAMTRLLANVGLSDLERRLREEAIDETTILDLDEGDMKEIGLKMGPRRKLLTAIREAKDRRTTPGADWARSPPPPPPPPASTKVHAPAKPAPGLTVGAKARLRKKAAPAPATPAPAPEAPAASNSDALECPITYELFIDPVTLEGDGVVYEREAIENWLRRGNLTSPATGVALKATQTKLIPNAAVRRRAAAAGTPRIREARRNRRGDGAHPGPRGRERGAPRPPSPVRGPRNRGRGEVARSDPRERAAAEGREKREQLQESREEGDGAGRRTGQGPRLCARALAAPRGGARDASEHAAPVGS